MSTHSHLSSIYCSTILYKQPISFFHNVEYKIQFCYNPPGPYHFYHYVVYIYISSRHIKLYLDRWNWKLNLAFDWTFQLAQTFQFSCFKYCITWLPFGSPLAPLWQELNNKTENDFCQLKMKCLIGISQPQGWKILISWGA